MTILEDLVWRGDNDMKKTVLLIIPLLFLFVGCEDKEIEGCTDSTACNYNPDATKDDGSCEDFDCAGECGGTAYLDECAICVSYSWNECVKGCTDNSAENYDWSATYDDGSCQYDTTPPTISYLEFDLWNCDFFNVCTEPFFGGLDFSASAYDYGSGVVYVEAWIDWESLGKDYYSPYDWTWNPFLEYEGYKTFKVRAYDEAGNYNEETKTFYFIPYN